MEKNSNHAAADAETCQLKKIAFLITGTSVHSTQSAGSDKMRPILKPVSLGFNDEKGDYSYFFRVAILQQKLPYAATNLYKISALNDVHLESMVLKAFTPIKGRKRIGLHLESSVLQITFYPGN